MKLLYIFALISVAAATLAQEVPVDPTQLTAWQNFFDKTNGGSWTRCRSKRDSPCTCEGTTNALVQCTEQNGVLFITSIRLRNNNLAGPNVPGSELNAIMTGSPAFTSLDIASNSNLRNTRGGCINIPACSGATCRLDYTVCSAGSTTPAPSTTGGSAVPTTAVTVPGAQAWAEFFDATGGPSWTRCKATRTTPCDCQRNQAATAPIRVLCTGRTITRVSLINNNLNSEEFPARAVGDLILAGASYIDLSANTGLAPDEPCYQVPECAAAGVTCIFAKPLCSASLSPATDSTVPTASGSIVPTVSPMPATTAPTTATPATTAPTTATPSGPSPTTSTPTIFFPPSTPPAGTPTTSRPATSGPSATARPSATAGPSGTAAPSTLQTKSPTAPTTTAPPTNPVTVVTGAPTTSAAIQDAFNGAVLVSCAVAALALA